MTAPAHDVPLLAPMSFDGLTVDLEAHGVLGYVHYEAKRDGKSVASGAISRWNYPKGPLGDRALREAIRRSVARSVEAPK